MRDRQDALDNAHKTAITRRGISAPMKHLIKKELLLGATLDYGCGKGSDAIELEMDRFDPHHHNVVLRQSYDTITCHYVINTLLPDDGEDVLRRIKALLNTNGRAYITVRRDVKIDGFTSRGTYQRNVLLDLPIVHEVKRGYCIYLLKA